MTFDYPIAFSAVKLMGIFARVGAFTLAIPIFNSQIISNEYKTFFILIISIALMPVIPADWISYEIFQDMDLFKLAFFLFSEALLGLTVALIVLIIIEVFNLGGELIDRDVGFSMAQVVDPASEINNTLFSAFFVQIFYIMFIIFDGHHEILRLAAASFQTLPPGGFLATNELAESILMLSTQVFVAGIQIALPIVVTMLLISIALGLLARIGEDFEVMMISFPVKLGLSFIILIWTFPIVLSFCRKMTEEIIAWIMLLIKV